MAKMSSHVIWGEVEASDSSGGIAGESSSASVEQLSSEIAQGSRTVWNKALSEYLNEVTFEDSSCSNEDSSSGNPGKKLLGPSTGGLPSEIQEFLPAKASSSAASSAASQQGAGAANFADTLLSDMDELDQADLMLHLVAHHGPLLPGVSDFWSKGSELHKKGTCKPCHYAHTRAGCKNGQDCVFCHLPHTKGRGPRPCKTKRDQCRRLAALLEEIKVSDPENFKSVVQIFSSRSPYLRGMMRKQMQDNQLVGDHDDGFEFSSVDDLLGSVGAAAVQEPPRRKHIVSL